MSNSVDIRNEFDSGYKRIYESVQNGEDSRFLVHAFCGVGKSHLMYKSALRVAEIEGKTVIIIFPSIALITQFNKDYIKTHIDEDMFESMSICSVNEAKCTSFKYSTDSDEIRAFLESGRSKIICCTYQSIETFYNCLNGKKVDLALFDEAHHTDTKDLVHSAEDDYFYKTGVFLTATPSSKIEDLEKISYIPYYEAYDRGYVRGFELRVDIGNKNVGTLQNRLYESIARAVLTTGNSRVMTFHSFVTSEKIGRSNVNSFCDEKKFKIAFQKVKDSEFADSKGYQNIKMVSIDGSTKNRNIILNNFDKSPDKNIMIVCSCKTIGEGIDTRRANMCVFVDPKNSHVEIIQNIGRVLRKNKKDGDKKATILLPCMIDYQPYKDSKTIEEQDDILRKNINSNDDYSIILNVVSALKQDSEEYFNSCLAYPMRCSTSKAKRLILNEGKKEVSSGDLKTELNGFEVKDEYKPRLLENLANIARENKVKIEVKTTEGSEMYGDEGKVSTLFRDGDVYTRYGDDEKHIVTEECEFDCKCWKCKKEISNECIQIKKKLLKEKLRVNIHVNDEFKVLWKVRDESFINSVNNVVIDCVVQKDCVDSDWKERMEKLKKFIDENGRRPSQTCKNMKEKKLGSFLRHQLENYKKRKYGMIDEDRRRNGKHLQKNTKNISLLKMMYGRIIWKR